MPKYYYARKGKIGHTDDLGEKTGAYCLPSHEVNGPNELCGFSSNLEVDKKCGNVSFIVNRNQRFLVI